MSSTRAQLRKRIDSLAPSDNEKQYILCSSRDYADAAARDAAATELKKVSWNVVILRNVVDRSGCTLWQGSKVNAVGAQKAEPLLSDAGRVKNNDASKPVPLIFQKVGAIYGGLPPL